MKKLLLTFLLLLPFVSNAQVFYEPSEIDAMWRVWDSADTFNWILQNGQKVNVSINPKIQFTNEFGGSNSIYSVTEVSVCFVRNNKILALTFSKSQGIRMYTEKNIYKLSDTFSAVNSLVQQSWFNIDFENITYSPILDWLIIPCGYYYYSGYNALSINLNTEGGVYDVYTDSSVADTEAKYYNLQGMPVDENSKGQVIIKKDQNGVSKYLNR